MRIYRIKPDLENATLLGLIAWWREKPKRSHLLSDPVWKGNPDVLGTWMEFRVDFSVPEGTTFSLFPFKDQCLKYQLWLTSCKNKNAPSCSERRVDLLDWSWRLVNLTCAWTGVPPPPPLLLLPPPPNFLCTFKEFHMPFHTISITFVTVALLSCKLLTG